MRSVPLRILRFLARPVLAVTALSGSALATWSIVAVDTSTGEVCVASATCLANFNLERWVPVILVGKGAAAAQSSIDTGALNRMFIFARMDAGFSPRWILNALPTIDNQPQNRQYGMVTLAHAPMTFTGSNAGFARKGVTGGIGTIKYAIQGNLLAGNVVIDRCEQAFRQTQGDLGQRVMAGMTEATKLGGDGRCSCSPGAPTSCGAPPPDFEKASHVAFIVLARIGDVDGGCDSTSGCASGQYYLDLQRITDQAPPDPVLELRNMYAAWRANLIARPDHILSEVDAAADSLVADGLSETLVTVRLVDVDGNPLMSGGAALSVDWTGSGPPVAVPGPVLDHLDGSYSFPLVAGATAGDGSWSITADDGIGAVRLYPDLQLRVDPLAELHAGRDTVSVSEGAEVPFVLNLGAAQTGQAYILLGSTSGTVPGTVFNGIPLALNRDVFFAFTVANAGGPNLPGSVGGLDGNGRATAGFVANPAELSAFGGRRFDWAAVIGNTNPFPTNNVGFDVVP